MTQVADLEVAIAVPPRFQRNELARHAGLSVEATTILRKVRGPLEFISALVSADDTENLASALAFVLPKREAVWWACLAARLGLDPQPSAAQLEALRCAEAWVVNGTDEVRQQAEEAAEALEYDGAAAWAAIAAFWSGGSLAPAGLPEVPPAPHLTAIAVRATLRLSAHAPTARASLADLCTIGLDILAGRDGRAVFERVAAGHAGAARGS